jgi:hypothetical protein
LPATGVPPGVITFISTDNCFIMRTTKVIREFSRFGYSGRDARAPGGVPKMHYSFDLTKALQFIIPFVSGMGLR